MNPAQPERIPWGVAVVLIIAIAVLAGLHVTVPPILTYALAAAVGAGAGVASPKRSSP